jgi:hypothetical protein
MGQKDFNSRERFSSNERATCPVGNFPTRTLPSLQDAAAVLPFRAMAKSLLGLRGNAHFSMRLRKAGAPFL